MRTRHGITPALILIGTFVTLGGLPNSSDAGAEEVKLNEGALSFGKELIEQGRFVSDRRYAWGEQQSSAGEENEFIRQHGFAEYAKWHLGIDDRHAENSKARYKFPFG